MSSLKGKTYEEIYGKERAAQKKLAENISKKYCINKLLNCWKKYGPFSREELRTQTKKYGIPHIDTILRRFGSFENIEKELGIKFVVRDRWRNIRISKEKILKELKIVFENHEYLKKTDLNKLYKCRQISFVKDVIRSRFGSLDNAAKQIGFKFVTEQDIIKIKLKQRLKQFFNTVNEEYHTVFHFNKFMKKYRGINSRQYKKYLNEIYKEAEKIGYYFHKRNNNIKFTLLGKNEKEILDFIEQKLNIKLIRQKSIGKYWIDGYDKKNNIVYEVNEYHHKFRKEYDKNRERIIMEKLNCLVVRIDEKKYLKYMRGD